MATLASTSTPAKAPATPQSAAVEPPTSTPPTGTWRHPRFDEINRRLNRTNFTDQHVRKIAYNVVLLALTFMVPELAKIALSRGLFETLSSNLTRWWMPLALRLLFVSNVAIALLPLFRRKDDLCDIPLTPTQRKLFGLDPSSAPATPGSNYITPPRYSRSATPRSSGERGGSPRSRRESPLGMSGSYSPASSPLLHRAVGGGFPRRLSYGSGSPLGTSLLGTDSSGGITPPTPTPGPVKTASVGLNNKWLYEKTRSSSGSRGVYT
ncbi:nuclear pore complex component-domain-containing protein [Lineolata rhizophorae]|uniref:Nuclear pore complex component-domain-containing protein n=1 Tax=Lineolata rhizophorae TaxID=578093 RepID=A0A6A6NUR3_9PEZI|nr:nuclear pore complex component-domain-containing protein [Lineolata rhizophorae]